MELNGMTSVSTITAICYLIAQIIKATIIIENKWIPIICMLLGGILGVLGMIFITDFPASDLMSAIAVGITSGGAATSINHALPLLSIGLILRVQDNTAQARKKVCAVFLFVIWVSWIV